MNNVHAVDNCWALSCFYNMFAANEILLQTRHSNWNGFLNAEDKNLWFNSLWKPNTLSYLRVFCFLLFGAINFLHFFSFFMNKNHLFSPKVNKGEIDRETCLLFLWTENHVQTQNDCAQTFKASRTFNKTKILSDGFRFMNSVCVESFMCQVVRSVALCFYFWQEKWKW